jgi:hypothetical protein
VYSPLSDLGRVFGFLIYTQSVVFLGRGMSPSQGRYIHREQHKGRINALRHPCLVRFKATKPVFLAGEDSSCPRSRGHCDRLTIMNINKRGRQTLGTSITYEKVHTNSGHEFHIRKGADKLWARVSHTKTKTNVHINMCLK